MHLSPRHTVKFLKRKMTGIVKVLRRILSNVRFTQPVSHQQHAYSAPLSPRSGQEQIQNVGVVDIDPKNLMTTLRRRYGNDGFEVHVRMSQFANCSGDAKWWLQMMHNRYCIRAAGQLSPVRNTKSGSMFVEYVLSDLRNEGGPGQL
jgi:hypothetical protein